jgi:hypothetical protein
MQEQLRLFDLSVQLSSRCTGSNVSELRLPLLAVVRFIPFAIDWSVDCGGSIVSLISSF